MTQCASSSPKKRVQRVHDETWRYGDEGFASTSELDLAALLLVHHSRAFNRKDDVLKIMRVIIEDSPGYTAGDTFWMPPRTWLASRKYILNEIRSMLGITASYFKGLLAPVTFVLAHNFDRDISARTIDTWRKRLCAGKNPNGNGALLAMSGRSRFAPVDGHAAESRAKCD